MKRPYLFGDIDVIYEDGSEANIARFNRLEFRITKLFWFICETGSRLPIKIGPIHRGIHWNDGGHSIYAFGWRLAHRYEDGGWQLSRY